MMFVADMHCDTLWALSEQRKKGIHAKLVENDLQLDLKKMYKSNYMVQNFAIFVDRGTGENPYECYKKQLKLFQEEIKRNPEKIGFVKSYEEIENNVRNGRMSALLTVEEGEVCQGELEKLEELYTDGVRMMTFTWNYENSLGSPASKRLLMNNDGSRSNKGLTEKGIAFLEKMEALGMIPDVSHLSKEGFYDVCRYSKKPFVASHSDAKALCNHKRNLNDDMIRKIAQKGGVIGVNYYGQFLRNDSVNDIYFSTVSHIAEHILHFMHVGGIACVGLGSDYDGMDDNLEMNDCSKMELLYQELKKRGLSETEIEAIFYKNVCNLYKEILKP